LIWLSWVNIHALKTMPDLNIISRMILLF